MSSGVPLGVEGLQLKLDILLWREEDKRSSFEKEGEDGILRKEVGESKLGRISAPMTPLQMFVLANVALALKAAPERHEKELLLLWRGDISHPWGALH